MGFSIGHIDYNLLTVPNITQHHPTSLESCRALLELCFNDVNRPQHRGLHFKKEIW